MLPAIPVEILTAILTIFLFLALCGALALVTLSLRRPATMPLAVATGLVVLSLAVVAVSPVNVPTLMGFILTLLGITLAVLGGNPLTRRILEIATHGRVRETPDGGIMAATDAGADVAAAPVLLRGGTVIGYLERLASVVAILAGYPEAIAVIVAVKGIGRFSELATAEARERFIIGTFASLLWACVVGGLVRLAIW